MMCIKTTTRLYKLYRKHNLGCGFYLSSLPLSSLCKGHFFTDSMKLGEEVTCFLSHSQPAAPAVWRPFLFTDRNCSTNHCLIQWT